MRILSQNQIRIKTGTNICRVILCFLFSFIEKQVTKRSQIVRMKLVIRYLDCNHDYPFCKLNPHLEAYLIKIAFTDGKKGAMFVFSSLYVAAHSFIFLGNFF